MRGQDLLEKIEGIDPAYVEAADAKPKAARRWVKWGALAACAVLAEGDAADRKDILFLEKLPLFFK